VDNHLSNSKFCLTRILADRGKEPMYEQVKCAKGVKDLCDALGLEYAEKLLDAPSRGDKSAAAKAANRTSPPLFGSDYSQTCTKVGRKDE
jgi:hypothetical protein